jgi:hypothetical protein
MKRTLIIAMAATGLAIAGPVAAHHQSICPECIEDNMDPTALERHNDAVDEVLEMGMPEMTGDSESGSMTGETQDPADQETYSGPGSENGTTWTSRDPMIPSPLSVP